MGQQGGGGGAHALQWALTRHFAAQAVGNLSLLLSKGGNSLPVILITGNGFLSIVTVITINEHELITTHDTSSSAPRLMSLTQLRAVLGSWPDK